MAINKFAKTIERKAFSINGTETTGLSPHNTRKQTYETDSSHAKINSK
jgi:hypothetical protein